MKPGQNMRKVLRYVRGLGVKVKRVKCGELRLSHSAFGPRITVCGHRKDSPRALMAWIKRVEQALPAPPAAEPA